MKFKTLFLASAAALTSVSFAHAADAVMAPEPEPVEYVRVCDAYGAGFFYIPGTETCLKISGYVWYQLTTSNYDADFLGIGGGDAIGLDTGSYHIGATLYPQDGWFKSVRARVNFDARSETEWGTLRSYIRFQASWNGVGDGPVAADQAYIELGGFRMGYSESFWVDSGNGGPSNYGSHSWTGMYYGYQQRALIGYRFEANGFFGALSLEDDNLSGEGYMPDVVAKLGYMGGWGAVWIKAAYDESFDGSSSVLNALGGTGFNDGGFAAQLGVQFNIPNMPGSSLRVIGYYADGAHAFNVGGPSNAISATAPGIVYAGAWLGGGEWSVLTSYNHQFSETLGVSIAGQYFDNLYLAGTDLGTGADAWAAELSVVWFPVSQFEVRGEVAYTDVGTIPAISGAPAHNPDGTWSGFLRFTRYF